MTLTRGQLVRKDVVTRTTGVRLGTATNLWVDVDEWEVVALDVRPYVRGALLNGVGGGAVDHVLMSSLRQVGDVILCLLYTSPSPRDATLSRMPSSA